MKFSKSALRAYAFCAEGEQVEDVTVVLNRLEGNGRWSLHFRLVICHKGKYYETDYSIGATESQDESPFDYEPEEVECKEVRPLQVTVTEYVAINGEEGQEKE